MEGPYAVDSTAIPNTSEQQVKISTPADPTFFRLRDDQQNWIIHANTGPSNSLILHYHADP